MYKFRIPSERSEKNKKDSRTSWSLQNLQVIPNPLKQELPCGFSLIATPVGDAGLSIKYLDFALAMGKLRCNTDDTKLRASFSTLVDHHPDDQMGVSSEKFRQLLSREI